MITNLLCDQYIIRLDTDKKMKNITSHKIKNLLQDNNLSPSIHRVMVLDYLLKYDSHPSVQTIYSTLSKEIPTLSKTTVYNILNKFINVGLAKELRIEGNEVRYDGHIEPHAHFKCDQCESVLNLRYQCPKFLTREVDGHEIHLRQVNFIGICKECKEIEIRNAI